MTTSTETTPPFHPVLQASVDQLTKFGLKVVNKWKVAYAVKSERPWMIPDEERAVLGQHSYRCLVSKEGEPGSILIDLYDSRAFSFKRGVGASERQLVMTPEYLKWVQEVRDAKRLNQAPTQWVPTWTLLIEFSQLVVNKENPNKKEQEDSVKKLINTDPLYVFGWVVKCLRAEAELAAHKAAEEQKRLDTAKRISEVVAKSGYAPEVVQHKLHVFSRAPGLFTIHKHYGVGDVIFNEEEAVTIIRLMMQAIVRHGKPSVEEEESDESRD